MKLHSNIQFDDESVDLKFPLLHALKKFSSSNTFVTFKVTKNTRGNGVILVMADSNRYPVMFMMTFHDGVLMNPINIVGEGNIEIINDTEMKVNINAWSNVSVLSDAVEFE